MILNSELTVLPIYRVGGGVSPPVLISKIAPEYSEEPRQSRLQGSNLVYVGISPEGKTTAAMVVRALGMGLDEKAMEAIKRWRFQPGMRQGQAVAVEATIDVSFKLL
jgi:periplasmic protein TonB